MRKNILLICLVITILSCFTTQYRTAKDDCIEIFFNHSITADTSIVKCIREVVFDTTAAFVHGHLIDGNTFEPISNAFVKFYNNDSGSQFLDTTDNNGNFRFFANLLPGPWNVRIEKPAYKCVIIKNIVHTGGQWFDFKIKKWL
jgi:hypothetical protein